MNGDTCTFHVDGWHRSLIIHVGQDGIDHTCVCWLPKVRRQGRTPVAVRHRVKWRDGLVMTG